MSAGRTAINLKQLRYFIKTVETGNITKAAEELHLAQTALGLQIRHLEDTLKVRLLVRHSRGTSTTEAGQLLYNRAIGLLRCMDQIKRDVMALGEGQQKEVRLGVASSILGLIGPDLVVAARGELPDVSIHFVGGLSVGLTEALNRGELDLILAFEVPQHPSLTRVAMSEEELLFITTKNSASNTDPVSFSEVIASDLAFVSDRDTVWRVLHSAADQLSLKVNVAYFVQSLDTIHKLVARGLATGVAPYGTVVSEMHDEQITARPIDRPVLRRTLFLARQSTHTTLLHEAALMRFIDAAVRRLVISQGPYGRLIGDGLRSAYNDVGDGRNLTLLKSGSEETTD